MGLKKRIEAVEKKLSERPLTLGEIDMIAEAIQEKRRQKDQAEVKRNKDGRLRNTKLLLRNYHSFQKYVEQHKNDDFSEEEEPIQELILNYQDIVSSIRITTKRTIVMFKHLDNALKALQYICEMEEKEGKTTSRHYDVLHKRFIEQRAIEEIAEEYDVNERTVYKFIDSAAERLSVLLFGVYGIKVE